MKTRILGLLATLTISLGALAQTPSEEAKINEIKEKLKDHPEVQLVVKESRMNREKNKYSLTYGTGFFHSKLSRTFNAGYFLTPDKHIGLTYISSVVDHDAYFNNYEGEDPERIKSFGLNYRSFQGNSFFVNLGVNYRTFEAERFYYRFDGRRFVTRPESYKAAVVSTGLGNQWQWRHFTLGVEWVGANYVIHEFENDVNRDAFGGFASSALNLLNIFVGASF